MKAAIVTGASSGIGLEISKSLIRLGYKVYGIGRKFNENNLGNNFIQVVCDATDISTLCKKINEIQNNEEIYILINNAGVGYFGPHEEININKIHNMVTTNLEVPIVLSGMLLRQLKSNAGFIINISSVTAKKSSTHGCAYAATKAGLTHFSNSLFDETRKYGVKVITIHPDITQSNFYRNADFMEEDTMPDSYLVPKEVADAVEMVLTQREGMVITDITIKPQRHMIKRKKR